MPTSPSTQNQALAALLFLCQHVLDRLSNPALQRTGLRPAAERDNVSRTKNMPGSVITDVKSLLASVRRGRRPKHLFFWGHQPSSSGVVGREFLSQWWPAPFVVDHERYPTAEHFMMAAKARLFGDVETGNRVLQAPSPGAAKRLGREVRNFDESVWVEARFKIVVGGSIAKFQQNPALRAFLLGTKDRILVEASPLDRIWGIGLSADDSKAENPELWRGLNLLGFALMEARRVLATESLATRERAG